MWTCQSNPSSLPWPWEPVLVVSLYFYPVRVIKYKQSMRPLGLGLKTHLPYSHWGPHSLSLLKGVDLYWWLLPEGDISCSMWQPHFVQRCHSRGGQAVLFVGAAQGPVSSPHSGSTARQRPARQHTAALLGWEGHKGRESQRAVIVFQFNQLHCDRSTSIGGMMSLPPSAIPTLTPFELWAVLKGRMETQPDFQNVATAD